MIVKTLRISTLNIWNKSGPWPERLRLIRRELESLSPDILGLQEVLRYMPEGAPLALSAQNDQATEIAEGLGFNVAYALAADYSHGLKLGNALLSRHPILEEKAIALPGAESGETRSLLYCLLDTPDGRLPVFVTHLNWKFHHGSVRLKQVLAIADAVFELAPVNAELLPAVLMGDFNAAPETDEIRFLRGQHVVDGKSVYFADAWSFAGEGPGYTYARDNDYAARAREPSRRIDYIFVRGPDRVFRGEPITAKLAFSTPDSPPSGERVWPSDHFGLYADVVVEPRSW
jgi:endonuclease/exonuclease/phosphatase family metal-dependent hydrolase